MIGLEFEKNDSVVSLAIVLNITSATVWVAPDLLKAHANLLDTIVRATSHTANFWKVSFSSEWQINAHREVIKLLLYAAAELCDWL